MRGRWFIATATGAAVLGLLAVSPSAAGVDAAAGAEPSAEPAPVRARADRPDRYCVRETRTWSHALDASYDVGRASAYGLGYQIGRLHTASGYPDFSVLTHVGLGFDVVAMTRDHSQLDALAYTLAARTAVVANPSGFGLELRGGVADPRAGSTLGFMSAGVFFSLFILELGYSYQFPLAESRPDWLSSHQFSLRIHVPVWRQGLVVTDVCDRSSER
jgi:hypothetical protein